MFDPLERRGSIGQGLLIGLGLNLCLVIVMLVTGLGGLVFLLALVQLLYLVPIALSCRRRRLPEAMKGIIISMAITFLLNATCDAMLMNVFARKR